MNKEENILAINIGINKIKWILFDEFSGIISDGEFETELLHTTNIQYKIKEIVEVKQKILKKYKIDKIGISITGSVLIKENKIIDAPQILKKFIGIDFNDYFDCEVKVIKESDAIAIGELFLHNEISKYENVIVLNMGQVISGSVMINGEILDSKKGRVSNFGKILIGSSTWDSEENLYSLIRKVFLITNKWTKTLNEIIELSNEYFEIQEYIDEFFISLAKGLSVIISIFDPELILLAGELFKNFNLRFDKFNKRLTNYIKKDILDDIIFQEVSTSDLSALYGINYFMKN